MVPDTILTNGRKFRVFTITVGILGTSPNPRGTGMGWGGGGDLGCTATFDA